MAALLPDRPLELFCGVWRRCLQTRVFGTFALAGDANSIVAVDRLGEVPGALGGDAADYQRRHARAHRLRWSFGRSTDSVRTGYVVEPLYEALALGAGGAGASPRVIPLRVSFSGHDCLGTYQPDLGLLMTHLVGATTATIVYRLLDDDTIAVSLTEVPSAAAAAGAAAASAAGGGGGGGSPQPIVQHGWMFRVRDAAQLAAAPVRAVAAAAGADATTGNDSAS